MQFNLIWLCLRVAGVSDATVRGGQAGREREGLAGLGRCFYENGISFNVTNSLWTHDRRKRGIRQTKSSSNS